MFKLLPAIDLRGGQCVRLKQGDYAQETCYSDTPAEVARTWVGDVLHIVDLDGAKAGCPVNTATVKAICTASALPCEIGGGIRTFDDAVAWFACGVARVIVGTAALRNPELVEQLIAVYGTERVVLGIDARDGYVAVSGWTEASAISAVQLATDFAARGITRIIFTDIATDGMLMGPNFDAMKLMCDAVPAVSVIASGGVSTVADILGLRRLGCSNLEGAIVGRAIYENPALLPELFAATRVAL